MKYLIIVQIIVWVVIMCLDVSILFKLLYTLAVVITLYNSYTILKGL